VLPGLAIALYLAARRELRRITTMMIPAGVLVVAAIVVPWYAALYQQHGWDQIRSFLLTENVARYTAGEGVRQDRGLLFYLPVLVSDSLPWSLLLVPAAVLWRRWRSPLELLLWCWIIAIVGFFSLSAGKQDLYILPIVPAVAALGGVALSRVRDERACRWASGTLAVLAIALTAAGVAVLYLFAGPGRVYALSGALAVGWIAVFGGIGAAALGLKRKPLLAAGTIVAALTAANWLFVLQVLPAFERYKPVPAFARTLGARLQPGDAVAEYQLALPSLVYYLQRHVDQYFDAPPFIEAMRSNRRTYAVLSREDYDALRPQLGAQACVIAQRPIFNVKLGNVLAQDPLPDVLLVSNDCR
jgi:4-amino-4-deoxy-L-arabinose transferase-like glycosyltransferase